MDRLTPIELQPETASVPEQLVAIDASLDLQNPVGDPDEVSTPDLRLPNVNYDAAGTEFGAIIQPEDSVTTVTGDVRQSYIDRKEEEAYVDFGPLGLRKLKDAVVYGGNIAGEIMAQGAILYGQEVDPSFNIDDHKDYIYDGLPSNQWEMLRTGGGMFPAPKSLETALKYKEYLMKRNEFEQQAAYAGFRGASAYLLSGVVDLDSALMLIPGGTYSGAKVGRALNQVEALKNLPRVKSTATLGAAGLESGALLGVVSAATPHGDWSDLPNMSFGNMIFGSAIGAATGVDLYAAKKIPELHKQFQQNAPDVMDMQTTRPKPRSVLGTAWEAFKRNPEQTSGESLGAAATGQNPASLMSNPTKAIREHALAYNRAHNIETLDTIELDTKTKRVGARFAEIVNNSPLKSDYYGLMGGTKAADSPIGTWLTHTLFENPLGIAQNNQSAARYMDSYNNRLLAPVKHAFHQAHRNWANENGFNLWEKTLTGDSKRAFHKLVKEELDARYHTGKGVTQDVHVKAAADAHDAWSMDAHMIARGVGDEIPVNGFTDFESKPGWTRQSWDPRNFRELRRRGVTEKQMVEGFQRSYMKIYEGLDPKDAKYIAKATVQRYLMKGIGADTNSSRILDTSSIEFIRETMELNDLPKNRIDAVIGRLKTIESERGKLGTAKRRMRVDGRDPIPGTEYTLNDLMNSDLDDVIDTYSRQISGASALARNNIQIDDIPVLRTAWVEEQMVLTGSDNPHNLNKRFDAYLSYFLNKPTHGGLRPETVAVKRLTQLATLNGQAMTQLAETGVIIAAGGWDTFIKASKNVAASLKDPNASVTQQFARIGYHVGHDHFINDPKYLRDTMAPIDVAHNFVNVANRALGRAVDLQGVVTGMNYVVAAQQKVALEVASLQIYDMFKRGFGKAGDDIKMRQLTGDEWPRFEKYFKDGTVHIDADNRLQFGFDKWSFEDADAFARAMNVNVNRMVQRSMAGESFHWFGNDAGALFAQLKTFTLTAMMKQFGRNMIMGNEAFIPAFTYSLLTAGVVAMARETMSGRGNYDPVKITTDAFSISNISGFIPMWLDPIAAMAGMDDLRFNKYNVGPTQGVIPTPVAIPTLNRMARAPIAWGKAITGNADSDDVFAMQATPLVGNHLLTQWVYTAMRNDIKERKAEERAERRAEARREASKDETVESTSKTKQATPRSPNEVLEGIDDLVD